MESRRPYRDLSRKEAIINGKRFLGDSFSEDMIGKDTEPDDHADFLDLVMISEEDDTIVHDERMMSLATKFKKGYGIDLCTNGRFYDYKTLERLRSEWRWVKEDGEFRRV